MQPNIIRCECGVFPRYYAWKEGTQIIAEYACPSCNRATPDVVSDGPVGFDLQVYTADLWNRLHLPNKRQTPVGETLLS